MSPIYEEEGRITREDLLNLSKRNQCKECGERLELFIDSTITPHKAFLACTDWRRSRHEGIEREASRYEMEGLASLNIPTRREIMEQQFGKPTTKALDKYIGVVSLTKLEAKEILVSVYPDAPEAEITRAVLLCASYGLNPLMKHVFLIPFNRKKEGRIVGTDWVTVLGIKAKRLLASRRGPYSYIDDTPRVMTDDEQKTRFGQVEPEKLWVITKGKDPATGAEAAGYGFWPKNKEPYGIDKGNTAFNMAAIRSESQMVDRLRPGEMPEGIDVMPEEVATGIVEGEFKVVDEEPTMESESGPKEHWCEEHNRQYERKVRGTSVWYAHSLPSGKWCNEKKKAEAAVAAPLSAPEPEPEPEPAEKKPARDIDAIKTITQLYKACNEDFQGTDGKGMQPADVIRELGVNSQSDISDTPSDCYRIIQSVRSSPK